jgi:septum formation inhibitor-activating ATPase MinD
MAMTRVFVLTNHKGGVGKSTSATTIALGLAGVLRSAGASNSRVLLIDTDSQAHECLDHLLIVNAWYLRRILREYGSHYNGERTHQGLA